MNGLVSERKGLVLTVEEGILDTVEHLSLASQVGTYGSEGHLGGDRHHSL